MPPFDSQQIEEIRQRTVIAFARDMPLIMRGSGAQAPVDPQAAQFLSELTVQFISMLVDAAVETQHHTCDKAVRALCPPPPPLPEKRLPSKPLPEIMPRKRKQGVEYWDDPLPAPKIRGKPNRNRTQEWVGLQGVGFSSIRDKHVGGPALLSAKHFIFPICHDSYMYGKVTHLQSIQRTSIIPAWTDKTFLDMVRTEGRLPHHQLKEKDKKRDEKKKENDDPEESYEEEDEEEEEDDQASSSSASDEDNAPTWPGWDELMPFYGDTK